MSDLQKAVSAFQIGNLVEAERLCRALLVRSPRDPKVLVLLGMAMANSGRLLEGIEALKGAAKAAPDSLPVFANLSMLLAQAGAVNEANSAFEKAIRLAPTNVGIRLSFAKHLISNHDHENAIRQLRECLAVLPNCAPALTMLGFQCQALGKFDEARASLEKSISIDPKQGMVYSGIALGQRLSEKDRELITHLERILASGALSGRDLSYLHYALGKARADLGKYEEAMGHFDRANQVALQSLPAAKSFNRKAFCATNEHFERLFSKELISSFAREDTEDGPTPVFVLGVMRSGTTLIEQILSSHPDVVGGGEMGFWMQQGMAALRQSRGQLSLEMVQSLANQYSQALRAIASGSKWVTDKMPLNYQMIGLIHLAFPKAPILYVKRNAVDTCLSIWTTPFEKSPEFLHDKGNIVLMYQRHLALMEHWRRVLPPGRIMELQYEDVIKEQESETHRILEYCGMPWDDRCLRPDQNERAVYTASFWQAKQPVYGSSVERWRKYEPWLGEFRELLDPA